MYVCYPPLKTQVFVEKTAAAVGNLQFSIPEEIQFLMVFEFLDFLRGVEN